MSDIRSGTNEKVAGPAKVLLGLSGRSRKTVLLYLWMHCCMLKTFCSNFRTAKLSEEVVLIFLSR